MPQAEIDEIYLDSPYYLAPDDKVAEEAFAVIRDAMTKKKVAGIGRIVLARRERMLMLQPREQGHAGDDPALSLRGAAGRASIFDEIGDAKLPAEMLDIAQEIIDRMSGPLRARQFTDRYEEAVVAMLRAKQAGPDLHGARDRRAGQRRQHHGRAEARACRRRAATAPCAGRARQQEGGRGAGRRSAARKPGAQEAPRRAKRRAGPEAGLPLAALPGRPSSSSAASRA